MTLEKFKLLPLKSLIGTGDDRLNRLDDGVHLRGSAAADNTLDVFWVMVSIQTSQLLDDKPLPEILHWCLLLYAGLWTDLELYHYGARFGENGSDSSGDSPKTTILLLEVGRIVAWAFLTPSNRNTCEPAVGL